MLTKNEILAELKMRKRDYRQRAKEIRRKSMKWSEFIKKFQTGSFVTCKLDLKLEDQKRRLFIVNTASGKISHCSHIPNGDGIA